MTRLLTKSLLAISGALLGGIGGSLLIAPRAFLEMSHIHLAPDPSLLSEVSAPGGILIVTAVLMILGSIKARFTNLALVAGALVYGSYGISRLVSMTINGLPTDSLIVATVIELSVAVILVALKLRSPLRHNETKPARVSLNYMERSTFTPSGRG
ncbi:hypothetical protein GCM10008090_11310 [Arenicella chitinivorans]|uniref:DUF4345 domain-containing protein n=1 Tax=Arenicella chitinivorans TaxID=1329800 RepID=A0A918VKI3_9GAMM|nr:DUF4345 domain-containing protein [Arenicella chitinivorans]GHA03810.1 hypothetical protein GCM10008090_11310 [Arenicella chitinivorans]